MAATDAHFLDANIIMYAIGNDHPAKPGCVAVLKQVEAGAIQVVTNVEVFQELLHRYYSLGRYEVADQAFTNLKTLCEQILPVLESDLDRAYTILHEQPLISVRDAIHAATMLHNGLHTIISTDRHFDAIQSLTRIDPSTFLSAEG
ncbi:MAG TPA: type II toxin-antitoxin system VapC family toxin [Patescibacteria group bacterium]|nr:type II toxin-antitoxin system VapC family toxin [Patescibacteria group bacterium]